MHYVAELISALEAEALFPGCLDCQLDTDKAGLPMRTTCMCGMEWYRKYVVTLSGVLWAVRDIPSSSERRAMYYFVPASKLWVYTEAGASYDTANGRYFEGLAPHD